MMKTKTPIKKKRRTSPFKKAWRAIKKWKTRKTVLFTAIVMCITYTICNCLFSALNTKYGMVFSFDSTLTAEWFEFWKWVVISGGSITVAKVIKGKTNSDDSEKLPGMDEEVKG